MILSNKSIATAVGFSLMLITFGATADNGVEIGESTVEQFDVYYPCLGETVDTKISLFWRYREFETPSGKFHYLDNWRYTWEIRGDISELVWFGRGATPYVYNFGPGETLQFGESFVAIPVTKKGPKLRLFYRFKLTVNANGDLVAFHDSYDPETLSLKCFGKP